MIRAFKAFMVSLATIALVSCAQPDADLDEPAVNLGNFRLGHNIAIVVDDVAISPGSLQVTPEEWVEAIQKASDARFGRYEGERYFHLSYAVIGYNVSPITVPTPGLPIPPSLAFVHARIWDDQKGEMLTKSPKLISTADILKSSGIGATKQEQIDFLAAAVVKGTETWMLENPSWFGLPEAE